ncbi:MAG: outer membrane protein assembly factor BamD [Pseudomonadota bacterium]
MRTLTVHHLAALAAALTLAACAGDEEPTYVERPPEELYIDAHDAIEGGRYNAAADLFDEVERQHPYSQWATRAQLMAAYAHYQQLDYDEAVIALDRFIQLHPGHQDVDYAYYLTALSYYERISDVKRDQEMTLLALDALDEVLRRFPQSEYARDAQLKRDLTLDQLAGKEMSIGRWYLSQGHYNAAINRFRAVVETYQTTTHVPEALHRLTEAYLALGLAEEAQQNAAVLGHNYPGSEWYQDSYGLLAEGSSNQQQRSFFSRAWNSVF